MRNEKASKQFRFQKKKKTHFIFQSNKIKRELSGLVAKAAVILSGSDKGKLFLETVATKGYCSETWFGVLPNTDSWLVRSRILDKLNLCSLQD